MSDRVGWKLQKLIRINIKKNSRDQPTADILPESAIHKILSYLTFKEAAQMSILSKTWLRASLTHPNLKFTFGSSYENMVKIMERYRDGKIPIDKFEFINIAISQDYLSFLIDKCLGIALQNGVKDVRNLQKIRSLSIKKNIEQLVIFQAPTLQHLSYFSSYSLEELAIVECHNLKTLEVSFIYAGFIERLISRSQFLESLILDRVASRGVNICRSTTESLRASKIQNCPNIGVIDAPNLVSLEYEGYGIPQLKFAKESSKLKNFILDSCLYDLDAEWFCHLGEFLSNSISCSQVSLHIAKFSKINRKHLKQHHRVATPKVDVLDVNIKSTDHSPTFVDALLWSCHPRKLNISSTVKMIRYFIDQLMYIKNSSHSTSHASKPQLSQLKEI
ncbi:hypothetical protein H5410_047440 [Solanum commersonii]|uniref:F-box domain-containing protein n=1 Tax=Solanum commersonii TaxID=4109 RepID=A0A9J5XIP2_SOLCO|nr:hypothetical protein H5410_047440 [Solanum commersonii]